MAILLKILPPRSRSLDTSAAGKGQRSVLAGELRTRQLSRFGGRKALKEDEKKLHKELCQLVLHAEQLHRRMQTTFYKYQQSISKFDRMSSVLHRQTHTFHPQCDFQAGFWLFSCLPHQPTVPVPSLLYMPKAQQHGI